MPYSVSKSETIMNDSRNNTSYSVSSEDELRNAEISGSVTSVSIVKNR